MATREITFLQNELAIRKQRLETAIALAPNNSGLAGLLREVDSALERMDRGTYGLCLECHEPVEQQRLMADPLVRYCLDHLTQPQRAELQRDLDLASEVQRNLLPQVGLSAGGWETSYQYVPVGPVSGDYCDLISSDGRLFFVLGDVSGKGVAASMLMTQLHALFRSLTSMALPLDQIVTLANRVFCESALAGQYATLVCGQALPSGEVEIHNAGHLPAIVVGPNGVRSIESTGLPLGMFMQTQFSGTRLHLQAGDTLLLYTDGLSEARSQDEEYGIERLMDLLRMKSLCAPIELVSACLDDLRTFVGSGSRFDDLTVLAIQRRG
ncbi:MAG TPA: SpoIIE family protein phosphatase [Terriglobales bacterium]|jgi:phosphoserine phosphatase RsbU/P|nr:SpoIIE family protein phosphatase [Terriglobales bacterium]